MYKSNGKAYNTIFVVCVSSDTDDDCANDLADGGDVCVSAGVIVVVVVAAVCVASAVADSESVTNCVVAYGFDDDYLQGSTWQQQPQPRPPQRLMQHSKPPLRISVPRPNETTPTTTRHLWKAAVDVAADVAAAVEDA